LPTRFWCLFLSSAPFKEAHNRLQNANKLFRLMTSTSDFNSVRLPRTRLVSVRWRSDLFSKTNAQLASIFSRDVQSLFSPSALNTSTHTARFECILESFGMFCIVVVELFIPLFASSHMPNVSAKVAYIKARCRLKYGLRFQEYSFKLFLHGQSI